MAEDFRIDVENGKYIFIVRDQKPDSHQVGMCEIAILRNGEEWWTDSQSVFPWKAIHSLLWQYARDKKLVPEDM